MTELKLTPDQQHLLKKHLIPALDLDCETTALEVSDSVGDYCAMVKVGLRLFLRCGYTILDQLHARGHRVFLDLKFHDIPNTVADAVSVVAAHPAVELLTVHAAGGLEMIRAAVDAAGNVSGARAKVIAVTALTSLRDLNEIGVDHSFDTWVECLSDISLQAGVAGLVCSPLEVSLLRDRYPDALLVVPGIRLSNDAAEDQARVASPASAILDGASYIVVGRPIYRAADPLDAIQAIGATL